MYSLDTLNQEQLKPVLHTEGAICVTAGAGSGKTRMLTHRIAHLIATNKARPYEVLAITFTNKAAEEMKLRIQDMLEGCSDVWVMTIHALCVRILRRDGSRLGYDSNFTIYSATDSDRVLKRVIGKEKQEDEDFFKTVKKHISAAKNANISPAKYLQEISYLPKSQEIVQAFVAYEQELAKANAMDFDDLINKAYDLLNEHADLAEYYQKKFRYIHVDEFQDTNTIQYLLIALLARLHQNLFVVGDEDQSIYGWRGANIGNIFRLKNDFDCTLYKLEQNYRSTKKILEAANSVIAHNQERVPKKLWTENKEGWRVEGYAAQSENHEADYVVETINGLVNYYGYNYKDFAILMRLNALTRPFEERLMYYEIPHKVIGGIKFYERKEIKDILAYLKVLANPRDTESFARIINFPKRKIGDATQKQFLDYCYVENKHIMPTLLDIENNQQLPSSVVNKLIPLAEVFAEFYAAMQNMNVLELARHIILRLDIRGQFAEKTEENLGRLLNIDDLLASIGEFLQNNEDASLNDYLQAVSLYSDGDNEEQQNGVTLATIHGAKGLEYPVVFVVGVEEGIFPISRNDEMEEERRLMYVAITRAKERLYITRSQSRFLHGVRKQAMQSRFWNEAFNIKQVKKEVVETAAPTRPYVANTATKQVQDNPASIEVGDRVSHKKFGEGTVLAISGIGATAFATIDFDSLGKTVLAAAYAPLVVVKKARG